MKEAKWLITPRKKLSERDKIVCSNCGGQALYELDEDMNLERALSRCCPHCGCLISDVDMVNEVNDNERIKKEMLMVYDFCEKRKNTMDAGSESASDFGIGMMFSQQANCYWDIQQFIEVNFMEEENNNATD